jgi:hypothetical protein
MFSFGIGPRGWQMFQRHLQQLKKSGRSGPRNISASSSSAGASTGSSGVGFHNFFITIAETLQQLKLNKQQYFIIFAGHEPCSQIWSYLRFFIPYWRFNRSITHQS